MYAFFVDLARETSVGIPRCVGVKSIHHVVINPFGVTLMDYQIFNTVMGSFVGAAAILAVVVHIF
jgi:hypothetical protein